MRRLTDSRYCLLLIFLCFLWTSSGYLTWMYHLMDLNTGFSVEILTEVIGYLLQAAGLLLFGLFIKKHPACTETRNFICVIGIDVLLIILSVLPKQTFMVLGFGFLMNVFHGIIAGYYLYRLTTLVGWNSRSLVFGLAYGSASIGTWLLSLIGKANFIRSGYSCIIDIALAGITIWLITKEKSSTEDLQFTGEHADTGLILLAGITVIFLSLVKSIGFTFSSAQINQGINLELSRIFYAFGLATAGWISDYERKYGAVCCIALLGFPFIMIALSAHIQPSMIYWILNYLMFGFYTVFRVILFSDIARKKKEYLYLSGFGLLFGRIGDASGFFICNLFIQHSSVLLIIAAVLFAITIVLFFLLYQEIYLPDSLQHSTEQNHLEEFISHYQFSSREQEIFRLILLGKSNSEIANDLYIAESTVKFHIHNILKKTGCENRISLLSLYKKK